MPTDDGTIRRISEHIMGDYCTPGNPREVTVESMIPVVGHAFTTTY